MINILKLICSYHEIEYYYNKFNEQHTFRYYYWDNKDHEYKVSEIRLFSQQIENTPLRELECMLNKRVISKLKVNT